LKGEPKPTCPKEGALVPTLSVPKKGSGLELLALIIYNKNQHKEFYNDDKYNKCPTPQISH
jgi:hypothetical protein